MEAYPEGRVAGIGLTYAVEPEPLDTAGAVRFAATFAGIDETFVVVNGDVLTDLDLTALVAFHRARGAEGTIALHPVADPSAFGVVPTDDDGRVTAFVEKPPRDEAPTNEINAGTYVLEPSVLARIPEGGRVSIERETFPAMVRDRRLFARSDDRYWLDTGTPAAFLEANFDYLNHKRGPIVRPHVVDRGDGVLMEGGSDVEGDGGGSLRHLLGLRGRAGRAGGAQHPRARGPWSPPVRSSRTRCSWTAATSRRTPRWPVRSWDRGRSSGSGAMSGRSPSSAPTRWSRRGRWSTASGCRAKKARACARW